MWVLESRTSPHACDHVKFCTPFFASGALIFRGADYRHPAGVLTLPAARLLRAKSHGPMVTAIVRYLPMAMNGMVRSVFERARDVGNRLTGGGVRSLARRLLTPCIEISQQQGLEQAVAPNANAQTSIVYLAGASDTPKHHYRVMRYVEAAMANNVRATWIRVDELPQRMSELCNHDVLIISQVPWNDHLDAAFKFMRSEGKKIVFDADDLTIDPGLADANFIDCNRSQFLTEESVRLQFEQMRKAMLATDLCFATTEELAFHLRWAGKATYVLENGFDQATHRASRQALRNWRRAKNDELIRIGFNSDLCRHQRDLGVATEAIARLLRENAGCRLVLFCSADSEHLVDIQEYPGLAGLEDRIEWRPFQPLEKLPFEMARFDINIAPLEVGNPYCEAKSESKFFEAALVDVPTIASPTGPFRRTINHGKTGFLASSADDWLVYLRQLANDPDLRRRIGRSAYHAALARFGPMQRTAQFGRVLEQLQGGGRAARAFALGAHLSMRKRDLPKVFESDVIFVHEKADDAEVSVVVPLYNYAGYVAETLDSVLAQSLNPLDLVIVDGCSTDDSLAVAKEWAEKNVARFSRLLVLKNQANYGLAFCRNSGFDAAESPYVLPLDADNKLLPNCCENLLKTIRRTGAAYVYPIIQQFGGSNALMGTIAYNAQRFVEGNHFDAMALVSKEAWAMVGGYDHVRYGWEDYDFWCRIAELGLYGEWHPEVLAEYRVHPVSMLKKQTLVTENYRRLHIDFKERHPWVSLIDQETSRRIPRAQTRLIDSRRRSRIDLFFPILRCPQTHQKLTFNEERSALVSVDGLRSWPIREGKVILSTLPQELEAKDISGGETEPPEVVLDFFRRTNGFILRLGASYPCETFARLVTVEQSISPHADLVANPSELPFDDDAFDAITVEALERYREPDQVLSELYRVLKPGGRIYAFSAFLLPVQSSPWDFLHCTRNGMGQWFKNFEIDSLRVSETHCANVSIARLASEAEAALRRDVSDESAEAFLESRVGAFVDAWRDPSQRTLALWTNFYKLTESGREATAAGFELLGRKPPNLPDLTGRKRGARQELPQR
jgi:glycosyltransferase involved in cell wall biosynthesis/SAM-dependent methyltransferase